MLEDSPHLPHGLWRTHQDLLDGLVGADHRPDQSELRRPQVLPEEVQHLRLKPGIRGDQGHFFFRAVHICRNRAEEVEHLIKQNPR